ncbi:TPA: hypothetical protein HA344_01145 [Candidatus Bathyarchaeota archaeon]|nr:hypothetical protein [Candidatus Bathyarchaeota archaeon]
MDAFREHLVLSLKGGQAFVDYKAGLDGIKPELRGVRPNKALHSVYEELEHMRRAQEDLLDFALDPDWKPKEWPMGFWPEPGHKPTEEEWRKSVDGFFKDQRRALKLAKDEKIDLLSMVPQTENTYLRELMIIIEHNAYHFGKILDIRKALGDWK